MHTSILSCLNNIENLSLKNATLRKKMFWQLNCPLIILFLLPYCIFSKGDMFIAIRTFPALLMEEWIVTILLTAFVVCLDWLAKNRGCWTLGHTTTWGFRRMRVRVQMRWRTSSINTGSERVPVGRKWVQLDFFYLKILFDHQSKSRVKCSSLIQSNKVKNKINKHQILNFRSLTNC